MGRTVQKANIANATDIGKFNEGIILQEQVRSKEVEFLVDTGSAIIGLPMSMIKELGLQKIKDRQVKTANGVVSRGYYSAVRVTIWDREMDFNVLELFDSPDQPPLLGYMVLEGLDLRVDSKNQKLVGDPLHPDVMMIDLF